MISALNSAVSALQSASSVAAINANNTANINTPSYKSRMARLADMSNGGVSLSSIRINNTHGYAIPTGNPKDVAIFSNREDEDSLQSYYGLAAKKFNIDDLGNLRAPSGDILFTGAGGNVRLDSEGNLYSDGELIGSLTGAGNSNYVPTGEAILSGYMMGSNVNIVEETITSMTNLRYFQFNALTVRTADEMLGTLINLKS